MNAVIYARVSTDEQAAKGYSLPSQLEACRKYAEQNGFTVLAEHEFSDDYSGAKLQRPQFDKARDVLRRGDAGALIVYSSDRLTRSLAHSLLLREELQRLGVALHYVKRGKSEDTAEARMMENIEGTFNEYWRERIREASVRGTHRKAKEGKFVGNGVPPYGYRYVDGAVTIYEDEARVVRDMFRWYLEGVSALGIAKRLSELGVPAAHANRKTRKRGKCIWRHNVILRMLASEAYCGVFYFGRRSNGKWRDKSEWTLVDIPAIISRETWQAAQDQREHNKRMSPRNVRQPYLLRGMIRCGCCGAAMTGHYNTSNGLQYYRCSRRLMQYNKLEEECPQKWVRADAAEALVWNDLDRLMSNADDFERALIEARDIQLAEQQPKRDDLDSVERAITRCETDMRDYIQQRREATTPLHKKTLDDHVTQCEKQYADLLSEKAKLDGQLSKTILTDEGIGDLMQLRADIVEGMKEPDFETMRGVLEDLDCTVTVTGKHLDIVYVIGTGKAFIERMPKQHRKSSGNGAIESPSPH